MTTLDHRPPEGTASLVSREDVMKFATGRTAGDMRAYADDPATVAGLAGDGLSYDDVLQFLLGLADGLDSLAASPDCGWTAPGCCSDCYQNHPGPCGCCCHQPAARTGEEAGRGR